MNDDLTEGLYLASIAPAHAGVMKVTFPDMVVAIDKETVAKLVKTAEMEVLADGKCYLSMKAAVIIRTTGQVDRNTVLWEDE